MAQKMENLSKEIEESDFYAKGLKNSETDKHYLSMQKLLARAQSLEAQLANLREIGIGINGQASMRRS